MIYIYIYPKKYGGVGARPPRISILNFSQLFPVQISYVHGVFCARTHSESIVYKSHHGAPVYFARSTHIGRGTAHSTRTRGSRCAQA
jgi:hypothetical protein